MSTTEAETAALNGAEFRVLREALGLQRDVLALILGVNPRTIQRIEDGGHRMPPGLADELLRIESITDQAAQDWVARLPKVRVPVLEVYRTNEDLDDSDLPGIYKQFGASWYRGVALRVQRIVPLARIDYATPFTRPEKAVT